MRKFKKLSLTLALLITAATGAWAADTTVTWVTDDFNTGSAAFTKYDVTVTPSNNDARYYNCFYNYGDNTFTTTLGNFTKIEIVFMPESSPLTFSGWDYELIEAVQIHPKHPEQVNYTSKVTWTGDAESVSIQGEVMNIKSITFTIAEPATEPDIEVTTDAASEQDLFTTASFTMPANDVDVNYELVRDMQDEANPVAFSGLPSSGNIVVKKGSDGKYQPAEALTIQLIDPLAAAEAQNIIAADGITVKVLVGNGGTPIEYDQDNPITLEAFLADMKPGYYWIKAESTDENSPYDGTVYSSEFTVVEKYDLTVKPANDFSKNGLDAVTVGSESVTIDANTGEATKTGITPDTEVKIKAKRGYVIEKVEAKKPQPLK